MSNFWSGNSAGGKKNDKYEGCFWHLFSFGVNVYRCQCHHVNLCQLVPTCVYICHHLLTFFNILQFLTTSANFSWLLEISGSYYHVTMRPCHHVILSLSCQSDSSLLCQLIKSAVCSFSACASWSSWVCQRQLDNFTPFQSSLDHFRPLSGCFKTICWPTLTILQPLCSLFQTISLTAETILLSHSTGHAVHFHHPLSSMLAHFHAQERISPQKP